MEVLAGSFGEVGDAFAGLGIAAFGERALVDTDAPLRVLARGPVEGPDDECGRDDDDDDYYGNLQHFLSSVYPRPSAVPTPYTSAVTT